MANYNKVTLLGTLTRDPETKETQSGLAIAKLGLAINRSYKSKTGEKVEDTTFVDVDAFGKQAETLAKYMSKGKQILIDGRLKTDTWNDKTTGKERSKLGVVLESFQFIGGEASGKKENYKPMPAPKFNNDEDCPF